MKDLEENGKEELEQAVAMGDGVIVEVMDIGVIINLYLSYNEPNSIC